MKQFLILLLMIGILYIRSTAQVSINTDGSQAPASAVLEVKSANKGLLPPRMTTDQRNAISSPVEGLLIFNTDENMLNVYNGTSWAPPAPVICGQSFADPRDGKIYNSIMIGNQCWMKQNLNIGTKILGSSNQTNNNIIEKICYNDLESNCDIYGGLYQWNEAMQYVTTEGVQGICPTGWHLPTDAEWTTLTTYLGGESIAGGKMKETGTTHWSSPNSGATNSTGFTGLPGGSRGFGGLTYSGYFWASTQSGVTTTWPRYLGYDYEGMTRYNDLKSNGFSVRCIRN